MKKYILLITILISTIGMAQSPDSDKRNDRRMDKEKIEALAVAYITEQLELTPDEATKFWPVFNEIKDRHQKLERKKKVLIREMEEEFETLTDASALTYINKIADLDNLIHGSSYEQNRSKIIEIIGAKRFLKLMKAEMDFRRKMLREFKKRKGKGRP